MPWTEQQVRLFLSKASPLSTKQQATVKEELHANPAMGHKKPGPDANAKSVARYRSFRRKDNE